MTKDKKNEPSQPKAAAASDDPKNAPGIQIVAQYIKDFSFENPNAPESLVAGWPQPDTNVQIFLRHQPLREDTYECTINFRVEAKKKDEDKVAFIIDLAYGALAVLKNIPKEGHAPVIMVEVPKLLFPFAREIVANITSAGGYPPLYLTPISFEQIYMAEVKRQQEAKGSEGAGDAGAAAAG